MAWYYLLEGQSRGPVEAAELQRLLQNQVIVSDTMVWKEGMAEWVPLQKSAALASSSAVAGPILAGIDSRIAAGIIDWFFVQVFSGSFVFFVFILTASFVARHTETEVVTLAETSSYKWFLLGIYLGMAALYEIIFVGIWRATPGKLVIGIRVATADGGKVPFLRVVVRSLAKILGLMILLVGFLEACWDDEKRALYDMLCNTRVIVREKK